jgi:hypothetical protein
MGSEANDDERESTMGDRYVLCVETCAQQRVVRTLTPIAAQVIEEVFLCHLGEAREETMLLLRSTSCQQERANAIVAAARLAVQRWGRLSVELVARTREKELQSESLHAAVNVCVRAASLMPPTGLDPSRSLFMFIDDEVSPAHAAHFALWLPPRLIVFFAWPSQSTPPSASRKRAFADYLPAWRRALPSLRKLVFVFVGVDLSPPPCQARDGDEEEEKEEEDDGVVWVGELR